MNWFTGKIFESPDMRCIHDRLSSSPRSQLEFQLHATALCYPVFRAHKHEECSWILKNYVSFWCLNMIKTLKFVTAYYSHWHRKSQKEMHNTNICTNTDRVACTILRNTKQALIILSSTGEYQYPACKMIGSSGPSLMMRSL